jgi:5-methylcytosine-specific restriction endonuclease McrA
VRINNKCKYLTIRSKNYEKYFYCRLNKKIINYTIECIKCVKNEPRKNKGINKVSKKKITVTQDTYNKVMQRDNCRCRLCGTSLNLQLHHIIYRSEDKSKINDVNNCIMLCNVHHRLVHSNKHYWQSKLLEMNRKYL